MALIKCPECGRDVSDKAPVCPGCGISISESPVTIQRTTKKWKKIHLISVLVLFVGIYYLLQSDFGLGISLMFLSMIIGIIGRIGAWWTTG